MQNASNYKLDWAFTQIDCCGSRRQSYDDLVRKRFEAMFRSWQTVKRDDFKIEKNKCDMYRFFVRNDLPTTAIHRYWHDNVSILNDLATGDMFKQVTSWPIFLKCCHLSMGSADSVLRIKSRRQQGDAWVYEAKTVKGKLHLKSDKEIADWVRTKFGYKAIDKGRSWQASADKLTSDMAPGFMLQGPAQLTYVVEEQDWLMFEVKVFVQWGSAFCAMLADNTDFLFIRGSSNSDAEVVPHGGLSSILYLHTVFRPHKFPRSLNWVFDEDHFACIWPLAERAAAAMRIDDVRIDIFFTRGKSKNCVINEISLSSGWGQGVYRDFIGMLWAEPHVLKRYQVRGNATSMPVHMLGPNDSGPFAA